MCAAAIRWAGFKEVIYGSSIRTIAESKCSLLGKLGKADQETAATKSTFHRRWCGRNHILWATPLLSWAMS